MNKNLPELKIWESDQKILSACFLRRYEPYQVQRVISQPAEFNKLE